MKSKSEICNLALSRLGDKKTVGDIDNPATQTEKTFAKWYDVTRRSALRRLMPSFARKRKLWAKSDYKPDFGYSFAYLYQPTCLKVLGIGNMDNPETDYVVEGGYILTNANYPNGLPVRYVEDSSNIYEFDDSFIELFSLMLASNVAAEVTESSSLIKYVNELIPVKTAEFIAMTSQENKPFVINKSRLKNARLGGGYGVTKK